MVSGFGPVHKSFAILPERKGALPLSFLTDCDEVDIKEYQPVPGNVAVTQHIGTLMAHTIG